MKEEVEEDNVKDRERERKRERETIAIVNHITEFSNAIKYTSTLPKLMITTTKQ